MTIAKPYLQPLYEINKVTSYIHFSAEAEVYLCSFKDLLKQKCISFAATVISLPLIFCFLY